MGMSYRFFWGAVGWVALCLAPYLYALNDLITWRKLGRFQWRAHQVVAIHASGV
jgi:hypothetical protein